MPETVQPTDAGTRQGPQYLYWILGSIIIAGVALPFYYLSLQRQLAYEESKNDLFGNLIASDVTSLRDLANASVEDPLDNETQAIAQTALFWSGREGQVEAVRAAKREYEALAAQNNPERAAVVNRLISFANYGTADAQREIFAGAPFEQYLVPSPVETIKNLAEHSLSIYRTSFALQHVGMWHAARLIRHYDAMPNLSEDEVTKHRAQVTAILAEAAELYRAEEAMVMDKGIHDVFVQQFFLNQAYLHGVLALANPELSDEMKSQYENVQALANKGAGAGSRVVLLDSRVPFAELNAALFANALGGEHAAYAGARLGELVRFVKANPEIHAQFFTPFIRWAATARDIEGYWPTHSRIRELAALNADFAALLKDNGWNL